MTKSTEDLKNVEPNVVVTTKGELVSVVENHNYFETLQAINVSKHVEQKLGLSYLSWGWAWIYLKQNYPGATYKVLRFENNLPYIFDENTGYMVFTELTINELTIPCHLPVLDNANAAMKDKPYKYYVRNKPEPKNCKAATMSDINNTIMRCLTKNIALHGLGINLYTKEGMATDDITIAPTQTAYKKETVTMPKQSGSSNDVLCEKCGNKMWPDKQGRGYYYCGNYKNGCKHTYTPSKQTAGENEKNDL